MRDAVVEPHATLQRQPLHRPLILRVEVDGDDVAAGAEPAGVGEVLGDLIGHPVVGPDLNHGAVVEVVLGRRAEPALVAELHVVRAADVRHGRPPFVRPDVVLAEAAVGESGMPGDEAGDRAVAARNDGTRLFQLLDHRRVVHAADPADARSATAALIVDAQERADPGLRQQLVVDRKRPGALLHAGLSETGQARALGRLRRRAAAFLADVVVLLLPVEGELVALRCLPRETRRFGPVPRVGEGGLRQVEIHGPYVRIVGVLVDPHARNGVVRHDLPHREVEPEFVADNRAADLAIHVIQVLQLAWRPEALGLQRIREITGLHPALGRVAKGGAPERVAAVLRDDVQVDAGALGFAQPAGGVDHDFRRTGRIQELPASRGLASEVGVQPVGLGP